MEKTMLFPAQKESYEKDFEYKPKKAMGTPKSYILYCCMTLSVMLLTLCFAATELFAVFFSDVYPDKIILSKLFGGDAESGMSFQELMLNQSFCDLSLGKNKAPKPPEITTAPNRETESTPSEETTEKPTETKREPLATEAPETRPPTVPGTQEDIYAPNVGKIPEGMAAILPMDLSLREYGLSYIYNTSAKQPDMSTLKSFGLSTELSGVYPAGSPIVLILHTHATEGYSDEGSFFYDPDLEIARSSDKNKNVVHIGKMIADILNASGIPTLHSDILHDEESYSGSYDRSAQTVIEYLKKYPTIRYVIDVHRDAVIKSSGELVRPISKTERGAAAQIMAVVGTGESSQACPNYMSNLALAQLFREKLCAVSENLCRPTCLRPSAYNQQYSVYSMLIEVGAAGNTLTEAELAAEYIGDVLAQIIKGE